MPRQPINPWSWPGFAQRRVALVDQRPVADVAGVRDEHRAQAELAVAQSVLAAISSTRSGRSAGGISTVHARA